KRDRTLLVFSVPKKRSRNGGHVRNHHRAYSCDFHHFYNLHSRESQCGLLAELRLVCQRTALSESSFFPDHVIRPCTRAVSGMDTMSRHVCLSWFAGNRNEFVE